MGQEFTGGWIILSGSEAHLVFGPWKQKYLESGAWVGCLGYPTSEAVGGAVPKQFFQGGRIESLAPNQFVVRCQ